MVLKLWQRGIGISRDPDRRIDPRDRRTGPRQCPLVAASTRIVAVTLVSAALVATGCAHRDRSNAGLEEPTGVPAAAAVLDAAGAKAYGQGDFAGAVDHWSRAAEQYEREGSAGAHAEALLKLAAVYQEAGQYGEASTILQRALAATEGGDRENLRAEVLGQLGNLHIGTGQYALAAGYLGDGLALAAELGDRGLTASMKNNQGNLLMAQGDPTAALAAYDESAALAAAVADRETRVVALANAVAALVERGQAEPARTRLDAALEEARELPASRAQVLALTNLGLACLQLRAVDRDDHGRLTRVGSETLRAAGESAEALGDPRSASYAWGYLGGVYERQAALPEALSLTRRAVLLAQRAQAAESLYRWQWQGGRLLRATGDDANAVASYRGAIATLHSLGQETATCYGRAGTSFREFATPLYLEFVALLLDRAESVADATAAEPYLLEARDSVEVLKMFELQDYFQDDCFGAGLTTVTRLDEVSQSAVVVYTVVLRDRVELLVSFPGHLKRFTVGADRETLFREARLLRSKLEKRTTWEFVPHARQLYDWIIRPLAPDLDASGADTLVFVLDGPLRTIPIGSLYDGKQFLVERYATAVTPGLGLTNPRPLDAVELEVLVVGLSEAAQGFPPMPHVTSEVEGIHDLYPGKVLLNQDFLSSHMIDAMGDESFSIVHIASHAQFAGEANDSFLLTYDGRVTLDRLEESIGFLQAREEPLELLTLSACETAAGDDRAALGLAGVAVKAGARSALATLWSVNDQAASVLIREFYQELRSRGSSRAAALQRAQVKVLRDPRYDHPGFWAPFILVNNWL